MPKVEQYGPSRVQTQVIRGPRAPQAVDTGAGAIASGLQGLAQGVGQLQQRAAEAEARDALTQFERQKNEIFFNPQSGYFNSQGRDAFDNAQATQDQLEQLRKSYKFKSDIARQEFDRASSAHMTSANVDIMRHASKHLQAWEIGTIEAEVENSVENASLYWNNDNKLKVNNALGRQSIMDAAAMKGESPEATREKLQTFDSQFYGSVVEAAASKSSAQAKELLEKHRDRIEGDDLIKLESTISKAEKVEQTAINSQKSVLMSSNLVSKYGDEDNARSLINEEIDKIEDPELRQATSKEAKRQLDLKLKADSEERGNLFENAENFILEGGTVEQYKSANPAGYEKLTADQKSKLIKGEVVTTDYNTLSSLLLLPESQLAKVNPADHFTKLAKAERKTLINAVKSARSGGTEHQTGRTRTTQTKQALETIIGESRDWNKKKLKQANAFYSVIDNEVKFQEKIKGGPLSSAEFTELLDKFTATVTIERPLWFDSDLKITDIPTEDIQELSRQLNERNIPATAENLLKLYEQVK